MMKMSSSSGGGRWSPTQEQVMILEEIYRGGLTTPNASQIQHITSHLSSYGHIQPKNVFYWFQNHKARHRHKLRTTFLFNYQLHIHLHLHHPHLNNHIINNNNVHHHFQYYSNIMDHSLTTASPNSHHQLSLYNSLPSSFSQGGGAGEASSKEDDGIWKMENIAEGVVDGAACSYWPKPLKTLQLFPITSERLKDRNTSTSTSTSTLII